MIDDKKIEEEATNYAQDGYNNYDDNIQRIIEEAFKSGATWMQEKFLKELWHPANEEPIANTSPILFDGRDREGYQIVKTSFFRSSYWNKTVEYYGIVRWLYIDDLFTKEGGEQRKHLYLMLCSTEDSSAH